MIFCCQVSFLSYLRSGLQSWRWTQGGSARDSWVPEPELPAICERRQLFAATCRWLCNSKATASPATFLGGFKLWCAARGCCSGKPSAPCHAHNGCQISPACIVKNDSAAYGSTFLVQKTCIIRDLQCFLIHQLQCFRISWQAVAA